MRTAALTLADLDSRFSNYENIVFQLQKNTTTFFLSSCHVTLYRCLLSVSHLYCLPIKIGLIDIEIEARRDVHLCSNFKLKCVELVVTAVRISLSTSKLHEYHLQCRASQTINKHSVFSPRHLHSATRIPIPG